MLVETKTCWDLDLFSPKGVPTQEVRQGMSADTTIDLVWENLKVEDLLMECLVDADDTLNHHSNQKTVFTTISIKFDDLTISE